MKKVGWLGKVRYIYIYMYVEVGSIYYFLGVGKSSFFLRDCM